MLTREGFEEVKPIILTGKYPVWINGGILTESELNIIRKQDINLSNFIEFISLEDNAAIDEALDTISEHHPGERVWLEYKL
ncbi:hypothetical protein [Spartinivicinus poritis]|uniref:Uncharacterized protein n=1 Tax=Spartinivicinus poritis TaxID=2994640 RepID=A0ABT5UI29_9GAMM|nr:hypothetical protein [Spartinivicinus sp. A2-2]MDE1466046.1 hypothetical protein [Spartinivicinus sp. A2-2]